MKPDDRTIELIDTLILSIIGNTNYTNLKITKLFDSCLINVLYRIPIVFFNITRV